MIHAFAPNSHATATRLKDPPWNNICQQPTLIASRPHYAKRASHSTTQLQQCIQNVLNVLDDRAIVLTLSANFASALRDASAMQELAPLSPLGYLRAVAIYSEQGRQRAVVNVCNKGLSVVDTKGPGYSKLEEAKTVAMQRDACRVDFVGQLPLEMVMDVLFPMLGYDGRLDGKKGCPYLDVSKTWLDRALQTAGGGLHFNIADQCSITEAVRYAQHTKTIHIENSSQGLWLCYFFQKRANFCSLQELTIKGLKGYTALHDLVSSFKAVSNTLTHLTIWKPTMGAFQPIHPLHVADILINCPHLVMLDIVYRFDADFSAVPLTKTWPQLTTLSLNCRNSVISNGQFVEILKRLPSLKKLMLTACIETQPMTMIQHYYPSMIALQLKAKYKSASSSSSSERLEQQHQDRWMRAGRGGLEEISFSGDTRDGDTWIHMKRNMLQQHHNLVHLELNLDYAGNNDDDLFNVEFPCLKTLALQCRGSSNACFGWWIMGKAPLLEELSITTWAIESYPALDDFTPPHSLRKLVMNVRHTGTHDRPMAIEGFLHQFSQQKEKSSLKELKIHYDDGNREIPVTHVAAICSLRTVQHLTISYSLLWKQSKMDYFTKMLAEGCPNLISLELIGPGHPSAYAINLLKRLQHLRHLAFHMDSTDQYRDFWYAFRTFPQLKFIRILSAGGMANPEFVSYLKGLRPDIKVTT